MAVPHISCVLGTILPRHLLADPMLLQPEFSELAAFVGTLAAGADAGAAAKAQAPLQGL